MRIKNVDLSKPNVEVCVIVRGDDKIVFKCQAVTDYEIFNKLCPTPEPPKVLRPGQMPSLDYDNPAYKKEVEKWAELKTCYMYYHSLKATEGLEWDTVVEGDPNTWLNVKKELEELALTDFERARLIETIHKANGLSQELIEEAENDFLASQAVVNQ